MEHVLVLPVVHLDLPPAVLDVLHAIVAHGVHGARNLPVLSEHGVEIVHAEILVVPEAIQGLSLVDRVRLSAGVGGRGVDDVLVEVVAPADSLRFRAGGHRHVHVAGIEQLPGVALGARQSFALQKSEEVVRRVRVREVPHVGGADVVPVLLRLVGEELPKSRVTLNGDPCLAGGIPKHRHGRQSSRGSISVVGNRAALVRVGSRLLVRVAQDTSDLAVEVELLDQIDSGAVDTTRNG